VAHDTLIASNRPWISCKVEIAGDLTWTPEGDARLRFHFIVENVGNAPAMEVGIFPALHIFIPGREHPLFTLHRMAQHNRDLGIPPGGGLASGLALFPKETHTFPYILPIKRSDILKANEDRPEKYLLPDVFGLIHYVYPVATVRAGTGFLYPIERATPDDKLGFAFGLDEVVPVQDMRLASSSSHTFAT
jgi:hypothetical protein